MIKIVKNAKPSKEAREIMKALKKYGSQAYEEAKKNDCAYIEEDGWLVRVYADDHREKIKFLGQTLKNKEEA